MTKKDMMLKCENVKREFEELLRHINTKKSYFKFMKKDMDFTQIDRLVEEIQDDYKNFVELKNKFFKNSNKKDDMLTWFDTVEEYDNILWNSHNSTFKYLLENIQEKKVEKTKTISFEEILQNLTVEDFE